MEDEILQNGPNPIDNPEIARKLDRIYRYCISDERSYVKTLFSKTSADSSTFQGF